ncbi:MAG: type I-U CRISPR-associated protein Csb2 [Blastocatellia bacterium]
MAFVTAPHTATRGELVRARTAVRFALVSTELPPVTEALPLCERARRVFTRARVDTSHSPVFTGKSADGTPLVGHPHAFFLPEDADGDGRIDHLSVIASAGFDAEDLVALEACTPIFGAHARPGIHLKTCPSDGSVIGTSSVWRSLTPFSMPRFATSGNARKVRNRDLPESQLRRELRLRGFPEPARVELLGGYETRDGRTVSWSEFVVERRNGTHGFGIAGFEIHFPHAVSGPIALGFGCHFGLGVFVASEDRALEAGKRR